VPAAPARANDAVLSVFIQAELQERGKDALVEILGSRADNTEYEMDFNKLQLRRFFHQLCKSQERYRSLGMIMIIRSGSVRSTDTPYITP
jgi:hypothetical protein